MQEKTTEELLSQDHPKGSFEDHHKESLEELKKRNSKITQPIVFPKKKTHRNDSCSCGSGRKYKHCCEPKFMNEPARHYHAHKK